MSTIATVTPNLRPGYDRKMLESLSNRGESVPLIVVVVGDRTSKISRNKVDGHVQNFRPPITSRRQFLHGRTTNRVWSHHQSCVIVCQVVRRSVVWPVTSCPDWLYDQSAILPTISICNRSPRLVVRVSVRLLTIGEDERYGQSWRHRYWWRSTIGGTTSCTTNWATSSISGLCAVIMKHWWYDHVRSLCDLKSQPRCFKQLAATDRPTILTFSGRS